LKNRKQFEEQTRGWIPKELYTSTSHSQASSKTRVAYAIGYGVAIGVCELLMFSIYSLGWGNIERGLGPGMDLLSILVIVFPAVAVEMIIGGRLSRKLKERWRVKL
jgi:hypothetical protein